MPFLRPAPVNDGLFGTDIKWKIVSASWRRWFSDLATTVLVAISGSGTANYVAKFTGALTIGNSIIRDDGSTVGIGTAPSTDKLSVNGTLLSNNVVTSKQAAAAGIALDHNSAAGNFTVYLSPDNLTANRRYIFADRSGTAAITSDIPKALIYLGM